MMPSFRTQTMPLEVQEWLSAIKFRTAFTLSVLFVMLSGARLFAQSDPPQITAQPQDLSVASGTNAVFTVSATGTEPLRYQWRTGAVGVAPTNIPNANSSTLTLTNVSFLRGGLYSVLITNAFGAVTSDVARLVIDDDLTFRILSMQTNGFISLEVFNVTGYSRGGIAISSNSVFLTGNGQDFEGHTGRWRKQDLTGGTLTGQNFDALTSDLRTEKAYVLANGSTPLTGSGTVNGLIELSDSGGLMANRINLSTNITITASEVGIFAGYGRVVLYNSGDIYDIAVPSGKVTFVGNRRINHNFPYYNPLQAFWGVAEYFRGDLYLACGSGQSSVQRFRVRDGANETVTVFGSFDQGLSSMAMFTFSPSMSRWFFHYQGNGIFGPFSDTLGSAKAAFTRDSAFPAITRDPLSVTVNASNAVTLSVVATGENLTYQWLFNGSEIDGATNATFSITNALPANAGTYRVAVSTLAGTALSKAAVLTVLTVPVITFGPQNFTVEPTSNVTFAVTVAGPATLHYQWYFKSESLNPTPEPLLGQTNNILQVTNVQSAQQGLYYVTIENSWGITTSPEARLRVVTLYPEGASFRILSLGTSNSRIIDDRNLVNYEFGTIASSLSRIYYTGSATEQLDLENLSNPLIRSRYEVIASDLRTGVAYMFARTNTPTTYYTMATHLWPINSDTGLTNGQPVVLSAPIIMPGTYRGNVGFFSGYSRILVYNETNMYSISLPSGQVTTLGAMTSPQHTFSSSWAYWGLAEYVQGTNYVVYGRNSTTISRTRVPDGLTSTLATFSNIGSMSSFTASLYHKRWYFHFIGTTQFGGVNQSLGYADATFDINPIHHYEWEIIPSPQVINSPFNVRLTAKAFDNSTVTNHQGSVNLSGLTTVGSSNVSVTPISAKFVDGVWNGQMTVTQPSAGMYLRAVDSSGFSGNSSPFAVYGLDDLFITASDAPDPIVIGQPLTYSLIISNTGPSVATAVKLTNFLSPNVVLQNLSSSVGACTNDNGIVLCDFGDLAGASAATVTLEVTPTVVGSITNLATVSRDDADPAPGDNAAISITAVNFPALMIGDASLVEGNSGTNLLNFDVTLSAPSTNTVTVNFLTFNGTASSSTDYVSKNGTLTFAPGVTNQTIQIGVRGDSLYETNEFFNLSLNTPVNALIARNAAIGTILNDDPAPTVFLADASTTEGNIGTSNMPFRVWLSAPTGLQILIRYATSNGTATAGTDYVPLDTTLSFSAGGLNLTQNIQVPIIGDTIAESNEFFYVNFLFVSNAPAARLQAIGTITNEDGFGVLDHFVFSPVSSPQSPSVAFPVTITAKDFFDTTISNFNSTVTLSAEIPLPPATNSILENLSGDNLGAGSYTLGYSFTPSHDITMTHFRHYFGTKISLWTDSGVLLASRSITNADGFWSETALTDPLVLTGGARYRIAAFTGGANRNYYFPAQQTSFFADGTIDFSYYASNDNFPTNTTSPWWLADIRYSPGAIVPFPLTPTNSGTFVDGVWSGSVTLLSEATNVVLIARDAAKNRGLSVPFDVVAGDSADVITLLAANTPAPFITNFNYHILVSNAGPASVSSIQLIHAIPPQIEFLAVNGNLADTCTFSNGVLSCNLPSLPALSSTDFIISTHPLQAGPFSLDALALGGQTDPNPANNNASLMATICRDCDGDGMWDDWELAQGLNPSDPNDAALDNDHDGHTNLQEFMAGTDPNSSNSVTRISGVWISGSDLRLQFNGITGKRYRLERSDGMTSNWTPVVTFRIGSTKAVNLIDSSVMRRTNSFYRVRLMN